ncbi:MAG TPA: GreA/GreB family elongation factor [Aequorivita sp.]|nr:GreA/GreB family elongation factor [Aequorivita sp.]
MSRGFVREEDQEEAPFIPPRAPLPPNSINYVTPNGMKMLHAERKVLENEFANVSISDEQHDRIERTTIQGKLDLLNERIISARILDPLTQPQSEIRFGALVSYKMLPATAVQKFQIVGVDEADVAEGKIAFVSPIAVAITGHMKGDIVPFKLGNETRKVEIIEISYEG